MDENNIIERFCFVPSFLGLDIASISLDKLKNVKCKLEESEAYEEQNLFAFLCYLLEDFSKSENVISLILTKHPRNIQTNVIKGLLEFHRGEVTKAEDTLKKLKLLSKDDYLLAESKSEMAYAYSKMGAQYYNLAITMYEEVIISYPEKHSWKYRLAITIRRCQSPGILSTKPSIDPVENYFRAKQLFNDVIENSQEHILQSLSYVGLATLHQGPGFSKSIFEKTYLSKEEVSQKTIEYLDRANKLCPENETVLSETGRVLRNMRKYEAAIEVLTKAMTIKATDTTCHQLALAIKQIQGCVPSVIDHLEQAVQLSKGENFPAVFDLGNAFMGLDIPMYTKALECFDVLIEVGDYSWKRQGCEMASECYENMSLDRNLPKETVENYKDRMIRSRRECIINAAMKHLATSIVNKRERISPRKLVKLSGNRKSNFKDAAFDQVVRIVSNSDFKEALNFLGDIEKVCGTSDVDHGLNTLIRDFYREKRYQDCLDLVTILMVTDMFDIEQIALEVLMNIVEETAKDHNPIVRACFERLTDNLFSVEGVHAHVRLIFDVATSTEEADLIESWLVGVGLTVTKNDEGIFAFMNRTEALLAAMSGNVAILPMYKDNNMNLLENYPMDALPPHHPIIIPVTINNSDVPPILRDRQSIAYPELDGVLQSKGEWLKLFGTIYLSKY